MADAMKLPPGPKQAALWQTLRMIANPITYLEECRDRYGDPFTLRVLGFNSPPVVFWGQPQAIQAIFTTTGGSLY